MERGLSTTGEQTNCDLTCYVKKEANHVGPTLEARLYTLEYFWCVPSTRGTRRSLLSTSSPPPTGAVARRMRWSLLTSSSSSTVRLTPAPSPARAVACRARRKFYYSLRLLLVPTTLVREIIILFGIYMSFSTPSIYLYKATIKNTFCIYTRPQIVIETKVTTPSFPVYGSISKSLQPR